MTGLENWLNQATRRLSKDSAAQVRTEIQEHYESAREAALSSSATAGAAERSALTVLGDPKTANRQYRHVLLTCAEARMLRQGKWEANAFCSRAWLKWAFLAISVGLLLTGTAFLLSGAIASARVVLAGGIWMGLLLAAPFLPIYTPSRSRLFRGFKWFTLLVLFGMLLFAFGPNALRMSWLATACLWPIVWTEWMRVSIRRKLLVAKWPRQLYL
jgi:hypothetical protein